MIKKIILLISLIVFAAGCGETGGNAPYAASGANCAGDLVGGYCWYLGASGESCDAVCATHGGYNDATRTYAGSAGTNANCQAVLDVLSNLGQTAVSGVCTDGLGCITEFGTFAHCTSPATTSSDTAGSERACACNE